MKATCIVIPVFNRRATTLACLAALREQKVPDWADVLVVDDGSSDGTGEAIKAEFPQTLLLRGDGALWWSGAINLGMEHALEAGASHIIWLNDDCLPQPGSLATLLEASLCHHAIAVAHCILRELGEVHYAGLRKTATGLEMISCQRGEVIACDTVCGNCVCVPRAAAERIGGIDARHFPHAMGDADYGLRATAAGIPVIAVGSATCWSTYGTNTNRESWLLGHLSIRQLWKNSLHPTNGWLTRSGLFFKWRHWGLRGLAAYAATLARFLLTTFIRMLIPQSALRAVLGKKSRHHQRMEAVRSWENQKENDSENASDHVR